MDSECLAFRREIHALGRGGAKINEKRKKDHVTDAFSPSVASQIVLRTTTMRRAQSVRYSRPSSIALCTDDLGVLREDDESNEDFLRRQLLDKDRENDRLQTQIETLQAQLAQRPPLETIQELEKEYKHLELLLQGTQRENERCMTEMERWVFDYL